VKGVYTADNILRCIHSPLQVCVRRA